jgi:hypothetical protein
MALIVERMVTPYEAKGPISDVIMHLTDKGYNPLIAKAKQQFLSAFGETIPIDQLTRRNSSRPPDAYMYARNYRLAIERLASFLIPIQGDVFISPEGFGLFYLLLGESETRARQMRGEEHSRVRQLEIGFIGDEQESKCLNFFSGLVDEALLQQNKVVEWKKVQLPSPQFIELSESDATKCVYGDTISDEDVSIASKLGDQKLREFIMVIKRSGGGILEAEIARRFPEYSGPNNIIDKLVEYGLLEKQYVIMCKQTSNQINKVKSRDIIDKMDEIGIFCSCGRPISTERIEKLLSPTEKMHRTIDKSYWMTVKLVETLRSLGILDSQILLNLHDGPEEIDAFVNVDGTLIMFELTDNEFSMGHAYPFGGRIGLYKPNYAIMVSTKGIAPEVDAYFKRTKPEGAEIVNVNNLDELAFKIGNVITAIRSRLAIQILELFEPMALVERPLSRILSTRLGIKLGRVEGSNSF